MNKLIKTSCVLLLSTIITLGSTITANAFTNDQNQQKEKLITTISDQLDISKEELEFALDEGNLKNALNSLKDSQKTRGVTGDIRQVKYTENLILEEEIKVQDINSLSRASTTYREVRSTVKLKAVAGYTVADLTVAGYFRYNGQTSTAYDGASSAITYVWSKKSTTTKFSSSAVPTAQVRGTFDLEFSVNTQWASHTFYSATINGTVFCDKNGSYWSSWY